MTDNLASEYADTVRDSIEEKMIARDASMTTHPPHDTDGYEAALEALDEYPLEIVHQIGSPFEVVITVGGPDARLVRDLRHWSAGFELVVTWGGDTAVRRSEHITAMGEYFLSMYDDQ